MSDKEKLEKENEQFSSAILYVATAAYVGVCAMVFGALYAKMPSFGEAFLAMMKDYGTILAGIPVLVAVVVAKQQLDAMRRQHVATIKLRFRDNLNAIKEARTFIDLYRSRSPIDLNSFFKNGNDGLYYARSLDPSELEDIKKGIPVRLFDDINIANNAIESLIKNKGKDSPQDKLNQILELLEYISRDIELEISDISQYWS